MRTQLDFSQTWILTFLLADRHGDQLFIIPAKTATNGSANGHDDEDVIMTSASEPSPPTTIAPQPVSVSVEEEKLDKDMEKKEGLIPRKFDSRL